jgi:hypothetical protein
VAWLNLKKAPSEHKSEVLPLISQFQTDHHLTEEGNWILKVRYDYISLTLFIDVGLW